MLSGAALPIFGIGARLDLRQLFDSRFSFYTTRVGETDGVSSFVKLLARPNLMGLAWTSIQTDTYLLPAVRRRAGKGDVGNGQEHRWRLS